MYLLYLQDHVADLLTTIDACQVFLDIVSRHIVIPFYSHLMHGNENL